MVADGVVTEPMDEGESSGIVVAPAMRKSIVQDFRDLAAYASASADALVKETDDQAFAHGAHTKGKVADVMADGIQRKGCALLHIPYMEATDPGEEAEEGEYTEGAETEAMVGNVRSLFDNRDGLPSRY